MKRSFARCHCEQRTAIPIGGALSCCAAGGMRRAHITYGFRSGSESVYHQMQAERDASMSEPPLVSDFLVAHLKAWGVKRLFGYSGDGINGILCALDRAGNDPEFFQVR